MRPEPEQYRAWADAAARALQRWYIPRTGLWKTTGWWNCANALTALIQHSQRTGERRYLSVIETTFGRAQRVNPEFSNEFYDDDGWWALAWIAAFDLIGDEKYLDLTRKLFAGMTSGWDDTCGGGLWWTRGKTYKNAIANELFLLTAGCLHQRTTDPGRRASGYLDWALREWQWFNASGLIGPAGLVNDGLTADCTNNGGTTWTYNQGVIIGGLTVLHDITGDGAYLGQAEAIAALTPVKIGPWPPEPGSWDLLINCTPIGMYPRVDDTPIAADALTGLHVYDLVYNPSTTRLLRDAAAMGCQTIGGLEMLVAQAREQFQWWTGSTPQTDVMRNAALERLAEFARNENYLV